VRVTVVVSDAVCVLLLELVHVHVCPLRELPAPELHRVLQAHPKPLRKKKNIYIISPRVADLKCLISDPNFFLSFRYLGYEFCSEIIDCEKICS